MTEHKHTSDCNRSTIEMRLNFDQAEVIRHRLHIPENMAEVFGPYGDDVWGLGSDEEVQDKLETILSEIVTEFPGAGLILKFDLDNPDHKMVMEELVDGNTLDRIVHDMLEHEDHKVAGRGVRKALKQINAKWANYGLSSQFSV